jgi:hypothetical protein
MRQAFKPQGKGEVHSCVTPVVVVPATTGDLSALKLDPNAPLRKPNNPLLHGAAAQGRDREVRTPDSTSNTFLSANRGDWNAPNAKANAVVRTPRNPLPARASAVTQDRDLITMSAPPSKEKPRSSELHLAESNLRVRSRKSAEISVENVEHTPPDSIAQSTTPATASHESERGPKDAGLHMTNNKRSYQQDNEHDAEHGSLIVKRAYHVATPNSRTLPVQPLQPPAKRHQTENISQPETEIEIVDIISEDPPPSDMSYEHDGGVAPNVGECYDIHEFSPASSPKLADISRDSEYKYSTTHTTGMHESPGHNDRDTRTPTRKPEVIAMEITGSNNPYSTHTMCIDTQSKWNIPKSFVPYGSEGLAEWERIGHGTGQIYH